MARLILDTNLWSYLAAETNAEQLGAMIASLGHRVSVPPIALGEAFRTKDPERRRVIVALLTDRRWIKLASETELEAEDLIAEVRRLRPQWLRAMRRTDKTASWHDYWTRVYWREARADPDKVARRTENQPDYSDEILRVQAANKSGWPVAPGDFVSAAMGATYPGDHPDPDPGSRLGWPDDQPALWWRVNSRDIWWYQLVTVPGLAAITGGDTTHADWFGAAVDLPTMRADRAGFNRFWLFDVLPWMVPRSWWRSTIELIQLGTKLTLGNPGDSALVSHLPDCDYLLSADRRFVTLIQGAAATPEAPEGGVAHRVTTRPEGWLAGLHEALQDLPPPRNPSMSVARAEPRSSHPADTDQDARRIPGVVYRIEQHS